MEIEVVKLAEIVPPFPGGDIVKNKILNIFRTEDHLIFYVETRKPSKSDANCYLIKNIFIPVLKSSEISIIHEPKKGGLKVYKNFLRIESKKDNYILSSFIGIKKNKIKCILFENEKYVSHFTHKGDKEKEITISPKIVKTFLSTQEKIDLMRKCPKLKRSIIAYDKSSDIVNIFNQVLNSLVNATDKELVSRCFESLDILTEEKK